MIGKKEMEPEMRYPGKDEPNVESKRSTYTKDFYGSGNRDKRAHDAAEVNSTHPMLADRVVEHHSPATVTSKAFHEVYTNVPENVKKTGKTGKAKRAMMTAIALSKARAAGAKIPKKES